MEHFSNLINWFINNPTSTIFLWILAGFISWSLFIFFDKILASAQNGYKRQVNIEFSTILLHFGFAPIMIFLMVILSIVEVIECVKACDFTIFR